MVYHKHEKGIGHFNMGKISSYYFWKWADNDLPCHPREAHAALLRGQLLPALQTFDSHPLVMKLKALAAEGRNRGEEWHWKIIHGGASGYAQCVFVTCPCLDYPRKRRWKMLRRLFSLDLVGCDAESGQMVDFCLPKINCMDFGKWPDEVAFDVEVGDLPALMRKVRSGLSHSFGLLTNRRNHYVTIGKMKHRFSVEWRENYSLSDFNSFDHWAAKYPADSKVSKCYVPKGIFSIRKSERGDHTHDHELGEKEVELLRFSDTLRILEAFVRGEPRPMQYRWRNISHLMP